MVAMALEAAQQDGRLARLRGRVLVIPRNVPTQRPPLPYVLLPQNAWPWHGPTSGPHERLRVTTLRLASEAAMIGARGTIRIGSAIPRRRSSVGSILPNVLDTDFEAALAASHSSPAPSRAPGLIVAIGSLNTYRGFRTLIRAHAAYRAWGGRHELLVAGEGSDRYAEAVGSIAAVSTGVTFLRRRLERHACLDLMRRASVVVLPSHVEASPLSLLEACAVNGSVVASDIPGHREVLKDLAGPVYYPASSPDALAKRLLAQEDRGPVPPGALSDPAYRARERATWRATFVDLVTQAAG